MAFRHRGARLSVTKTSFIPSGAVVDVFDIATGSILIQHINVFCTTSFPGSPFVDFNTQHDPAGTGSTRTFAGTIFFEGTNAGNHVVYQTPAGNTTGEDAISSQSFPQWWASPGVIEVLGNASTTGEIEVHMLYQLCDDDTVVSVS